MTSSTTPRRYLCIIPARGGSKGIPGKNLALVAGRPLIAWSIDHALQSVNDCRVVVSTDDPKIAEAAEALGAEVPGLRPPHLAEDTTPTEPVLLHVLERCDQESQPVDAVILLQPTSPVRRAGALDRAIAQFERTGADSLVSVVEQHPFLWAREGDRALPRYDIDARPRRQDLAETDVLYVENGSIYITTAQALRSSGNRLSGSITPFVMGAAERIDIDGVDDLRVAEAIISTESVLHEA